MSIKTDAQLKTSTDAIIIVNGNREITPPLDNSLRTDIIDSKINVNGGNVVISLLGYTTELTPSDNKHFTTKKYVNDQDAIVLVNANAYADSIAYDDTPVFYKDGSRDLTGSANFANNYTGITWTEGSSIKNVDGNIELVTTIASSIILEQAGGIVITSADGNDISLNSSGTFQVSAQNSINIVANTSSISITSTTDTTINPTTVLNLGTATTTGVSISRTGINTSILGSVSVASTTTSTTTTNGSGTFAGGVGIAGTLNIGGVFKIFNGSDSTNFTPGTNGSLSIMTSHTSGDITIIPDRNLNLGTSSSDAVNIGRVGAITTILGLSASFANIAAPSASADTFKLYATDIVAGNSAPHFKTENGDVIRLYADSGWTKMTGTPEKGTFATGSITLPQLAGKVMALEAMLYDNLQVIKA
jgi:hypothetical protein